METDVRHENQITAVAVKGSVDALTAAELTETIRKQIEDGHANLVVDLSGLAFMSSAGLRSLLGAVKETRSHGGDLRIVSTNAGRSEEHTSELQSRLHLVCRLLLEKKKKKTKNKTINDN